MDGTSRLLSGDDARAKQGRTALFDAVTLALTRPGRPGHRRVILVVSDGRDTASVINEDVRLGIADRSDAVVYLVAIGGRTPMRPQPVRWVDGYHTHISELMSRTGGRMFLVDPGQDATQALREALDDLRSRYLLMYVLKTYRPQAGTRSTYG